MVTDNDTIPDDSRDAAGDLESLASAASAIEHRLRGQVLRLTTQASELSNELQEYKRIVSQGGIYRDWITEEEVYNFFPFSKLDVRRMRRNGTLPAFANPARPSSWLYQRSQIERLITRGAASKPETLRDYDASRVQIIL